jgi:hypothetical protein
MKFAKKHAVSLVGMVAGVLFLGASLVVVAPAQVQPLGCPVGSACSYDCNGFTCSGSCGWVSAPTIYCACYSGTHYSSTECVVSQ